MNAGDKFINDLLGEGFFEELKKSNELFKLGTQTVLDPEEMRIGLKIVPRTLMSFLISKLVSMPINSAETVHFPFGKNAYMNVNKGDTDSYSGSVISNSKPVYDFRNRSIPGIGIILLSTFELYNFEELKHEPQAPVEPSLEERVQKLIDQRLEERALIEKVIDQKLSEREAVQKLILAKLTETLKEPVQPITPRVAIPETVPAPLPTTPIDVTPRDIEKKEASPKKKGSPLKDFLDRKKPKKEFAVNMEKSDAVDCPDCGQTIFDDSGYSGCVCMGENMNSKIWIKKSEDGVKISFSRKWEPENIEMLLQVLRRQHE